MRKRRKRSWLADSALFKVRVSLLLPPDEIILRRDGLPFGAAFRGASIPAYGMPPVITRGNVKALWQTRRCSQNQLRTRSNVQRPIHANGTHLREKVRMIPGGNNETMFYRNESRPVTEFVRGAGVLSSTASAKIAVRTRPQSIGENAPL